MTPVCCVRHSWRSLTAQRHLESSRFGIVVAPQSCKSIYSRDGMVIRPQKLFVLLKWALQTQRLLEVIIIPKFHNAAGEILVEFEIAILWISSVIEDFN